MDEKFRNLIDPKANYFPLRSGLEKIESSKEEVFQKIFKDGWHLYREEVILRRIITEWKEIAGILAKQTQPVRVRGDELAVRTEKGAYAQELKLYTLDILKKLKKYHIGSIKKIRVEIGTVEWHPAADDNIELSKTQNDLPEHLQRMLREIRELK